MENKGVRPGMRETKGKGKRSRRADEGGREGQNKWYKGGMTTQRERM